MATMSPAVGFVDLFSLVAVHLHHTAEAILLASSLIVVLLALDDRCLGKFE